MSSQILRKSHPTGKAKIEPNINYKNVCRCCLKSDAEFLNLDTLMVARNLDPSDATDRIPLIRCLLFCIRTEGSPELPQLICIDCSKSLQIAYYFLQNAMRAHEILLRKLCPGKAPISRVGALFNSNKSSTGVAPGSKSGVRHECKICGTIIYNRMELKQHIRLHKDAIAHGCSMCSFVTIKQRQLLDHYNFAHNLTTEQAEARINSENTITEQRDDKQIEGMKVCTLEDIELLIPTVLTPEDYAQPKSEYDIGRQITAPLLNKELNSNNVSIGTEFLVLPDGSLQELNGAGVLFEYIDDSKNIVPPNGNLNLQSLLGSDNIDNAPMDIDVNDLIVEDTLPQIKVKPKAARSGLSGSLAAFKHKCKFCTKAFPTLARLKSHQLTHSNMPKFHCDQCKFFTLSSADLAYHYRTMHIKHEIEAAQTEQNSHTFSCDLCLFETKNSNILRDHYTDRHMVQPTEVQLRPSWTAEMEAMTTDAICPSKSALPSQNHLKPAPDNLGNAINSLDLKFPFAETMPQGTVAEFIQQPQATTTATITPMGDINVVVDATPLFFGNGTQEAVAVASAQPPTMPPVVNSDINGGNTNNFSVFPEISATDNLVPASSEQLMPPMSNQSLATSSVNTLIFGDMQDFIDNTDVAAICTIPADDMPVVDGDDIVIDNNNISLDFDAENLFEDFEDEDEEQVVGENDADVDEEDDDPDNDDENDNNDAAADQNLLLTSDDDDVDDFDDEQSKHLQKPYCIYCNKKFTSQYKFENHMFVHRGLAPYRCELCTNLYNMKRLLIRHYKTVHKRMPTRDMVQAKGDKISVARSNKEIIQSDVNKTQMLMCAKCPFECESDAEMKKHLNAHHGINDGVSAHANDVFIIRKLPFECPRCIRSFAAKRTLTRHLQRSHLVDTIIEVTNSAEPTTNTVLSSNAESAGNEQLVMVTTSLPSTATEIDGGECEADKPDKIVAAEGEAAPVSIIDNNDAITTLATASNAKISSTTVGPAASPTATTVSSSSNLFSTPTPFDLDYDFLGEATSTPSTSTNNNNNKSSADSFATADNVLPSHIINGTDKLLSAVTMEPSPIKESRTRLPRTPIYVCKQCNKTFDELAKLVKHEAEQHSSSEPRRVVFQHKCSICNGTFRTLTLLKFHMKRHLSRKFQCSRCSKSFNRRSELERHMLVKHEKQDNKDKTFRCSMDGCKKTFNYKHHMVRHQNAVHLKIRHVCNLCGEDLKTSFNLRSHMRVHSGNGRSYKCPNCDKSYVRRGPLRVHARQAHNLELTESDWPQMECNNICSDNPQTKKVSVRKSLNSTKKLEDKAH